MGLYGVEREKGVVEPFDMKSIESLKGFVQRVEEFKIGIRQIRITSNITCLSRVLQTCWDINIRYDFRDKAFVRSHFAYDQVRCQGQT